MPQPPATVPIPTLIARRYALRRQIGCGGISAVYEGWDQRMNRPVAVKLMRPEREDDARAVLEQTWREAMTAAHLRHPHVVQVYDCGSEMERAYIVMEYVEGENLEECLSRGPLHMRDFHRFAHQSLEAIGAAHAEGILHRDVKPSNFMLQADDAEGFRVKVLDFGLAKYLQMPRPQTADHTNAVMGSIHYMAPEQFQRRPIDGRTDLYALGCLFYEALTGHNAFDGESVAEMISAHLHLWPHAVSTLRPEATTYLEDWLMRFLQKEPGQRHPTARHALASLPALEECTRG